MSSKTALPFLSCCNLSIYLHIETWLHDCISLTNSSILSGPGSPISFALRDQWEGRWYSPVRGLPVRLIHSHVTHAWQISCSVDDWWRDSSPSWAVKGQQSCAKFVSLFSALPFPFWAKGRVYSRAGKETQSADTCRAQRPRAAFLSSSKEHWNVNVCIWKTGFGFNSSLAEKSIEFLQTQREKLKNSGGKLEIANARCVYHTISGSAQESREFSLLFSSKRAFSFYLVTGAGRGNASVREHIR